MKFLKKIKFYFALLLLLYSCGNSIEYKNEENDCSKLKLELYEYGFEVSEGEINFVCLYYTRTCWNDTVMQNLLYPEISRYLDTTKRLFHYVLPIEIIDGNILKHYWGFQSEYLDEYKICNVYIYPGMQNFVKVTGVMSVYGELPKNGEWHFTLPDSIAVKFKKNRDL